MGARGHCPRRLSHGRVRSSTELARRSRRTVRRARGRARERGRTRGARRGRAPTGNYDRAAELAERLAALGQALDDGDPAAAATTRTPSEAESMLAWALLGRAVAENDRAAAERSRVLFAAAADAAADSGRLMEQAWWLHDLAFSLFVLDTYSESIATAQRALRKLLEMEATLGTRQGWYGTVSSPSGSLVRQWRRRDRHQPRQRRPPHVSRVRRGVAEWAPYAERFSAVSRRARGRLLATRATRPQFAVGRPWLETRRSSSR